MPVNFRRILLAGTALVAVSVIPVQAHAFTATLTGPTEWGSAGPSGADGDGTDATAGDDAVLTTFALTVTNDGLNDDGSVDVNTFALGDVTGTTGSLTVTTGQNADLAVTVNSVNLSGAGAVSIANADIDDAAPDVTVAVDLTTGGGLTMTNTETDFDADVSAVVLGDLGVGGATTLTAGAFAGARTQIDVVGNAAFTGAVTLSAGAGAGSDATLGIGGDTVGFTGGLTLDDGAAGLATLNLTGTNVIVTGTINGAATGEGTVNAGGASGVTFASALGATSELEEIDLSSFGGDDVFSSTVRAKSIVFGTANTVTFSDNVTSTGAGIDFAGNAGTISLASGKGITGNVDDSIGASNGTLTLVGGAQTVSGTVGATNALLEINAGANASVSNFSGTVAADDINVTGTGTVAFADDVTGNLNFAGDGFATVANGKTITGDVSNTTDAFGTVTFAGDGTVDGSFGVVGNELKTLTMSASSGKLLAITGNAAAADTTSIAGNTVNVTGTFTLGAGQQMNATILTATTSGAIVAGGAVTVAAGSLLNLTAGPAYISTGDTWTIIDGSIAGGAGVAALTAGNIASTALLTYTQDLAETDSLVVTATRAAVDSALGAEITRNDIAVNNALAVIEFDGGSALDTVQTDIMNAQDVGEVHNILESLTPPVDGGFITTALSVVGAVQSLTDVRMVSLRSGDGMTGVSAGAASSEGINLWLQGYGRAARQDTRQSVRGYDATTWGWTLGTDVENVFNNGTIGLALNYSLTNVDSKNANSTSLDVGNYGLNLYGNFDIGPQTFVTVQAGYAYNQIASERHDVGGAGGPTAEGDYSGDQFFAKAGAGRDYMTGYGMTVTPRLSTAYTYMRMADYKERGAGAANLVVDGSDLNVLDLGIGVNASWRLENPDGSVFKPLVHAGFTYDVIGDEVQTTASFADLPDSPFQTNGVTPARSSFDVGAGFTYSTTASWDLSATYDYTYKADYAAHGGVLRAISKF